MFLPKGAYYATSNPNRDLYFFSLSFLKVCFHTILIKSKDIVFHVNSPSPPLPFICLWLISGFNLSLFHRVIRRLSFLSHMQVPLFWITVFVNILQLFFSIYIFSNLNMVIRSSNSCFCLYTEEPCLATTPFIQPPCLTPRSLSTQTWKSSSHFIILKTSSMRPPCYITTRILWPNAGRINVNIPKVGSAGRLTHLVQSPFCNGRVSLLAGPTILQKHFTRFSENPRAQWNGPVRHRPNKSHREFGYRACKQDTDQHSWGKQFCQMEGDISVRPTRSIPIHIGKGLA